MRLIWVLAWAVVAVWSLVAWSASGLIDLLGWLLSSGIEASGPVAAIFSALKSLGQGAIVLVWGLVTAVILSAAWVLSRATRAITPYQGPHQRPGQSFQAGPAWPPQREGNVIDLSRDQYAVRSEPRRDDRDGRRS